MDELDETQMKNQVESLKYQHQITREKTSVTIPELVKWVEETMTEDPFLNSELMKDNPWVETGKCVVL
ncbi:guanine nucleotide-binding protein G(I)/G(S)/G(O) subunit gamma-13a [Chanos chanos]|uniref:Guanine nucleotide-binding protein G(I)/G(S)/G(O) subunit gamma-13a n=1 Tax=Chanos chanos TaxID=29144 RepID=A0A6J2VXT8_CHACN|nr:guanine nucleotide-binding protein G(I)/G(S)/G(O) subunit gamma-13-like [Chanos chanos]